MNAWVRWTVVTVALVPNIVGVIGVSWLDHHEPLP